MGGSRAVARAAANDQVTIGSAAACDLADVVGGEVGGGVGGLALPPWAPVASRARWSATTSRLRLRSWASLWRSGSHLLGLVTLGMAVPAPGLATHWVAAVEAGADEGAGHRGLRLLRSRSFARSGGQRSPGPDELAMADAQRPGWCPAPLATWPYPWRRSRVSRVACARPLGRPPPHARDPGPGVGRHPDHGNVVERGPVLVTRWRSALQRTPPGTSANPMDSPRGTRRGPAPGPRSRPPSRSRARRHGGRRPRRAARRSHRWGGCRRPGGGSR